jgi:twitching motility protein PilT
MEKFEKLIGACAARGFSDLHISGGQLLAYRLNGKMFFEKNFSYRPEEVDALVGKLLNEGQKQTLSHRWSVDMAMNLANIRLRLNIFSTHRGLSMAIRFLPAQLPSIEGLNLHPSLAELCKISSGLLFICGPTGSGKTTTIAALLNEINRTRQGHVITLENPIEYCFQSGSCLFDQREKGLHFHTYQQGLIDAFREAPDVIVVGEMRSPEAMRLTLDAGESGHLVITTLHANTPEEAIYRICNAFPLDAQEFVRYQLSSALIAVVSQRLVYLDRAGFMVPHLSILHGTTAVRNTIRENKISQLENIMETKSSEGMFTFNRYCNEYIGAKAKFNFPALNFDQSRSAPSPQAFSSRMIDYFHDATEHSKRASFYRAAPGAKDGTVHYDQYGLPYEIINEVDLDDYIKQLSMRSGAGNL